MSCNQGNRIDLSVLSRRSHHHDSLYTGNLCRNDVHQNGGRVSGFSTWNIDTDTLKSRHLLTKNCAVRLAVKPTASLLLLVILTDVLHGFLHHGQEIRIYKGKCLLNLCIRHADCGSVQRCLIKFCGVLKKSRIFSLADIIHNRLHRILVLCIVVRITL